MIKDVEERLVNLAKSWRTIGKSNGSTTISKGFTGKSIVCVGF